MHVLFLRCEIVFFRNFTEIMFHCFHLEIISLVVFFTLTHSLQIYVPFQPGDVVVGGVVPGLEAP